MDKAKKTRLSVIVLKTLLYEILKKGKINANEKQIFQKVLKSLKLPQENLVAIQRDAKIRAKQNPETEHFEEKLFYRRLKDELKEELSPALNRKFIIKIAQIINSNNDIINNYIPSLFGQSEEKEVSSVHARADSSEDNISNEKSELKESNTRLNSFNLNAIDSLEILRSFIADEGLKYFNNILSLKSQGQHDKAIELLLDYSIPLSFDIRYYLLSRVYYEIHSLDKAKQFITKASKAGLEIKLIEIESYFHNYESLTQKDKLEAWKNLSGTNTSSEQIESLVQSLQHRNRNLLALELLESLQNEDSELLKVDDLNHHKLLNDLLSKTFIDIYFRYYGMTIIALQLAASLLVLSICLYNIGYIGPAFMELLHQMVAGIPNQQLFNDSLNKILPFSFLVIALVPVCYINGIMIWAGLQNKTKSYAQVHNDFIKICDFGKVYHLSFCEKDKPLFLYQDDNDYTYVSLVRHLPFVPNFTYIYAYDYLRGIYCLLPLYGVADGYLFSKTFLSRSKCRVYSINMLGVRLAQAATVIAKLSRTYLVVLPLILIMGVFFYANISFAQDASFESYLTTFLFFLVIVVGIILLPFFTIKWLKTEYINKILMVNIIKPGLILLVGLYLIQHYKHFGLSGIVPISVCLYSFYLLFIRTKYPPEKKQIVAQISANSDMVNQHKELITLSHGLKAIYLGNEPNSIRNSVHLFFNNSHLAIARKIHGMTLYYDVIQLTSKFKILVMKTDVGSRLRISTYNFDVDSDPSEVIETLKGVKLPYQECEYSDKSKSKIAIKQLLACLSLWIIWQFTAEFVPTSYQLRKLDPNIENIDHIVTYLQENINQTNDNKMVLKHRFEGIIYDREINYSDKVFSYYQNRVLEWGEYESSFQKAISFRSNLKNEDKLSQKEIETAISKLPPFVKSDGFRDDVINFFDWHLLTRWRTIDSLTQGNHIINYCALVNSTATQREDNLVCTYRFTYQNAIDWINKNKKIPIQFDIEILKELASLNGQIIRYATPKLSRQFSLILAAVSQNGMNLKYADSRLKNNPRIVTAALRQNHKAYQFMGDQMWDNRKVMNLVVKHNGLLLSDSRVGKNVRGDSSIVLSAITQNSSIINEIYIHNNFDLFMDTKLLNQADIALKFLEHEGMFLKKMDDKIKRDARLVKKAVNNNGEALEYADKSLKSDLVIVATAIKQNVDSAFFMDQKLWKEKKIVSLILAKNGIYLKKIHPDLKNDLDLVLTAVTQNSRASLYMDRSLWGNIKIVNKIVQGNGLSLENASVKLKNNYDICMTAVKENGMALEFVPDKFRSDIKLIEAALKSDGRALRFCTVDQRSDPRLIELAITNNIESIQYAEIPKEWFDRKDKATQVGYIYEHGIGVAKNLPKAKTLYSNSAEAGDINAMLRLAYLYLEGRGTNRDYDKSYRWFGLAADSGSLDGLVMLGYMKQNALAVNKDNDGAIELYIQALSKSLNIKTRPIEPSRYKGGYAKAAYLLGQLYASIRPKKADNSKIARGFMLVAAEQGYLDAQISLANFYFKGEHGTRSFKDSFNWFNKAARQGSLDSILASGLHHDLGLGVKVDQSKANKFYQDSKVKGLPGINCLMTGLKETYSEPPLGIGVDEYVQFLAERGANRFQCLLGSYFDKGKKDFNQNKQEAFEWMKKSAKNGNPEAQVYLSRSLFARSDNSKQNQRANDWLDKALAQEYSKSFTLKADTYLSNKYSKDYDNAIKWLIKAADLDEREAQRKLGMLYNRGEGVTKNQKVAFEWLKKASLNGDDIAMVNMATMYEFGSGITKNEQKAVLWYKKSAMLGNKQAAENLRILEDQGINIHKVQVNQLR